MTDGNGNVTTYTYDDQNRVTGVSRKNGNETISNSISYDMGTDGKTMTSVKDANGHVNKEVTNEAGLTESTTDLGDGEEQITTAYSYDTNGNKIRETYADGGYKTFDHDRKNRLIKTESYEAGEAGESIGEKTLKTVYSYDINDRLLESVDYQIDGAEETAVRYTEYQYDSRGQTTGYAELSQENEPTADEIKAHQIRYHYDSDGKLTKVTYPTTKNGVQALAYEYDQNGWLTKIKGEVQSADTSTEKTVRSYTYDSYGKVKEIKDYRDLLNSSDQAVKKDYTYDSLDRVKEMTYTDLETGKVMESYCYNYDKNSNITEKTEVNNYPKEEKDKVNETKAYTYDALGRLTKTVTTDHKNDDKTKTVTYTYDKAGNRTTEDDGTTQTAYTYNGLDQLQTATKEKGTAVDEVRQYSYDANGNQTDVKNTKTGQTESYTYDAENRLSKVSVTDKDGKTGVIQQNRYNGDGQRIQKVEGSKTTNYYYQDGVVSYTTDGDNSQISQNLIGTDGNILATQRYGSDHTDYLLYHKDIQGSTTSLVKEDGSADATYRYTDFGETTINGDNKAENEVCYTGGIYDQSTGLYYLNARYYNPEDGRFVTEDTYRGETNEPDTQNLYVYCVNNPVNYIDPSGHDAIVLKSNFFGKNIGHMAVLIQDGNNWKYFSWDNDGYKAKYMNHNVNNRDYKCVVNKKVNYNINKRFKRTGKGSKYVQYLYIKGNFKGSLSYIKKVKAGKSYRKYSLTGRNCAWMAIQVLRMGYNSKSTKYKQLYNLQYRYIKENNSINMITIVPKDGMKKLEGIYHKNAVNIPTPNKKK